MKPIFLASNSPRRKQLIGLGWEFEVFPAHIDETPLPGEKAPDYVLRLAKAKAQFAAAQGVDRLVVAADTTVVDGGEIFGKPTSPQHAVEMLQRLRGHVHQVYTALAMLDPLPGDVITDICITDVPMRNYSEAEIQDYVASGDPLDKAGAYAIQHPGFKPVEGLQGCYANVVGLPLCHLERALRKRGIGAQSDIPRACQAALNYPCPVYNSILDDSAG